MRDQLHQLLTTLRFQGMPQTLDRELDRAEREALTPQEVLYHLLVEESRDRQERSLAYRLRQAKLPWDWTLETFPFERCPELSKAQILSLAGLDFVARAQNIVFMGNPGTGKSGLAIGLLRQALLNGYRGGVYNAQELLDSPLCLLGRSHHRSAPGATQPL